MCLISLIYHIITTFQTVLQIVSLTLFPFPSSFSHSSNESNTFIFPFLLCLLCIPNSLPFFCNLQKTCFHLPSLEWIHNYLPLLEMTYFLNESCSGCLFLDLIRHGRPRPLILPYLEPPTESNKHPNKS